MTQGVGFKYAVEFDLQKSLEENSTELRWVKKMDNFIQERFPSGKLMNFGSHLNVTFQGWQDLAEPELKKRLDEVGWFSCQFQVLAKKLDLGDDNFQEAISVKPFIPKGCNANPLRLYEYLAPQKLAFDMGKNQ